MNDDVKKIGFFSLVSIVIGSQIGSGAFVLPSVLAPFKTAGLLGWIVSVSGAISLALIFAELAAHLPKNGGPHVYVGKAFGRTASFYTAWLYWIISWASSSILLVTTVNYLAIITGPLSSTTKIIIESAILFLITFINILGIKCASIISTILTILKILPLTVLPVIFFMFFDPSHFKAPLKEIAENSDLLTILSKTALLTFWGFIGVECATAPAESVDNPSKTIPRAIIIGTACVAAIYIFNTLSVIGVVGFEALEKTKAPYALVMGSIFPKYSDVAISIMAMIVCVGTLHAWTLTSGQIAYGAVSDGLFPKTFGKLNKAGAPVLALLITAFGMIPFFILEEMDTCRSGLEELLDMMVSIFVVIYMLCSIAYIVFIKKWYKEKSKRIKSYLLAQFAITFCIFVLYQDILSSCVVLAIFIILGIPVFWKNRHNIKLDNNNSLQ